MEDHTLYSAPSTPKPTDDECATPLMTSSALSPEYLYKMNDEDVRLFIKLRAANKALFTGRKNSARLAWRTILKEMGLHRKMSAIQAKKKWDNLQKKYKDQKNPPPGVTPSSWRWFQLMDDAMEGRLDDSAKLLSISSAMVNNDEDFLPNKPRSKRYQEAGVKASAAAVPVLATVPAGTNEIEFLVNDRDILWAPVGAAGQEMECDRQEMEQERAQLESDRVLVDKEREVLERERMVLEHERAGLQRELAALDRDRAALERERASVERDRAAVDWERAMLDKERARLERDRLVVGFSDVACKKDFTTIPTNSKTNTTDGITEVELDPECLERRQKFLDLFEKLLEKL